MTQLPQHITAILLSEGIKKSDYYRFVCDHEASHVIRAWQLDARVDAIYLTYTDDGKRFSMVRTHTSMGECPTLMEYLRVGAAGIAFDRLYAAGYGITQRIVDLTAGDRDTFVSTVVDRTNCSQEAALGLLEVTVKREAKVLPAIMDSIRELGAAIRRYLNDGVEVVSPDMISDYHQAIGG